MKFSIIIPVYNMAKYLDDCLQSVFCQDEKDYEVILIDDGSTDSSKEVIDKYMNNYSKVEVRYIYQDNAGHAAARQHGLELAIGDYVWFVDADDYIDANCLGKIWDYLVSEKCDVLLIEFQNVEDSSHFDPDYLKADNLKPSQLHPRNAYSATRIIKKALLDEHSIKWDSRLSPNDDDVFLFQVGLYANKTVCTQGIRYYIRSNPNSVTRTRNNSKIRKSIKSFMIMGEIYSNYLSSSLFSTKKHKEIQLRLGLTCQSILFWAAVALDKNERNSIIKDLESRGWYPYPILWFNITPKISIKRTLMDWSMLLFPCKWYYILYSKLVNLHSRAKVFK